MDDIERLLNQLLGGEAEAALAMPLPDTAASQIVDRLKLEADHYWGIDATRSLELADLIIKIGVQRGDLRQVALGTMARGDALRVLGQLEDAWKTLDAAGTLYLRAGDEVGWARTRIGRLLISTNLNRASEALADAETARSIFARYGESDKLLRLEVNLGATYNWLGSYREALDLYRNTLKMAEPMGEAGQGYIALAYLNMGYAEIGLGNFRQALEYYGLAHEIQVQRGETSMAAMSKLNMAYVAQAQGYYRRALGLFHRVAELGLGQLPLEAAVIKRDMVECYLALNRYTEARDLSQQAIGEFHTLGANYEIARTFVHLATAEAELGDFEAARTALDSAAPIFASLGAAAWVTTLRLKRGQIALRQGDLDVAHAEARAAADYFRASGEQINSASAILLEGQVALAWNDLAAAVNAGAAVVRIARASNIPSLRYMAHLLLGHARKAQQRTARPLRHYSAAVTVVERVQRDLTITLRPGFLGDKSEAFRALIGLHLENGRAECAFQALERTKSQILLGHIANTQMLRWASNDPTSQALIEELNRLREEHHWFYRQAQSAQPGDAAQTGTSHPAIQPNQALQEVGIREQKMRSLTEQLYLHNAEENSAGATTVPMAADIQASLSDDTLLIEYYNDGRHLWAFIADRHSLHVYPLAITVEALGLLLSQLQFNLICALRVGPTSPTSRNLSGTFQRISQRLYAALIEPFATALRDCARLMIVPYGALHYLPFHLLHTGTAYLAEHHEIVILPAAGLATRHGPRRPEGALVLGHAWDGHLPQTRFEAQAVHNLLGGDVFLDDAANRAVLGAPPRQVLHIAAHGEYRIDQPDLSYIQLADGQVYADDLFQNDLSYELVTLSACETGRANVVGGDELIGLGRGFLYVGAGAIIASLWRVEDSLTIAQMTDIYAALRSGATKAAALRSAQSAARHADSRLHPAFWGGFQLIGNADPLSTSSGLFDEKEQDHVRFTH